MGARFDRTSANMRYEGFTTSLTGLGLGKFGSMNSLITAISTTAALKAGPTGTVHNIGTTSGSVLISRTGGKIGLFGAAAVTRLSVTGSKASLGAAGALNVLLTKLSSIGLITNQTT